MIVDVIHDFLQCLLVAAVVRHHYGRFIPSGCVIEHVRYIGNGVLNVGWSRV